MATTNASISKPQYYGFFKKEHWFVVKLKRQFYPDSMPKSAGVWTGVTLTNKNRQIAKTEAEEVYKKLCKAKISSYTAFVNEVQKLGYTVDNVD